LVIVVRHVGSVLVHAHDGGIDYLHRRIMTGGRTPRGLFSSIGLIAVHSQLLSSAPEIRLPSRLRAYGGILERNAKRPAIPPAEPGAAPMAQKACIY
jgi:hypothetical protein